MVSIASDCVEDTLRSDSAVFDTPAEVAEFIKEDYDCTKANAEEFYDSEWDELEISPDDIADGATFETSPDDDNIWTVWKVSIYEI